MEEELEVDETTDTRMFLPPFFNWGLQAATWGWITLVIFEQDDFLANYLSYQIIAYIALGFVIASLILGVIESIMMLTDWVSYGYIQPHVSIELFGSFSLANGLMLLTLWAYTMAWWFFLVAQFVFFIIRTAGLIHFVIKLIDMKRIQNNARSQLMEFTRLNTVQPRLGITTQVLINRMRPTFSTQPKLNTVTSAKKLKLSGQPQEFYFPFSTRICYKISETTYETLAINGVFILITYAGSIALSAVFSVLLYR